MSRPTIDNKRTNLAATEMSDTDPEQGFGSPGSMRVTEGGSLILACPGCGSIGAMRVGYPKPETRPSWELTGLFPMITLSPSIHCASCCGWHGYLANGTFNSV